jgi:hypothetical protein
MQRRAPEPDEFSAAGGMPTVPPGVPGADLSRGRQAIQELTWGDFDRHVLALARATKAFTPEAVVGLVHGGVFVGGALAGALKVESYPVRGARRSRDTPPAMADRPEVRPAAGKGPPPGGSGTCSAPSP